MIVHSLLLASQLLTVAAADGVPTLDVGPGCRSADLAGIGVSVDGCLNDEKAAREQLGKVWTQFTAQDKSDCTDGTKEYNPSYVELLTCLEIARDAKIPYRPGQAIEGTTGTTGQK